MNPELVYQLWNVLWQQYRNRVSYARIYEQMIVESGGQVANDHIAFRSLRFQTQINIDSNQINVNFGIEYLERIALFLGYQVGGEYAFPNKHLHARYYYHPQQQKYNLPKLFISELILDNLPTEIQNIISLAVSNITLNTVINTHKKITEQIPEDVTALSQIFHRPWNPPKYSDIQKVNEITQYGAWLLLHGYSVNHFTGYINQQNTEQYPDIDITAGALAKLGVPMKAQIEGSSQMGLRQTATHAVTEMVEVFDDVTQKEIQIPWTYAYYEIAQRYMVEDSNGEKVLFEKFLGENASHLFEMTKLSSDK